ncbi:hypothetical protein Emag_001183 [Eimeria magna]
MPSAGESEGGPAASPEGRDTGGSKGPLGGPIEGPLGWATASSRSTTEGGAQYSSPARNSTHPASPVGVPRSASERTGVLEGGAPLEVLMGPSMGLPMVHQADLHAASSTQPRVLGGSQGRLSMRGPRGSPHGGPLHVTADSDHGEYVHLTDSDYGSGAEDTDAEGGYGGGSGARGPLWGRRRAPPSSLQRICSRGLERLRIFLCALLRRMLDKMPNYSGFLNQLTNFVFIPVFAAFCIHQYSQGKLSQGLRGQGSGLRSGSLTFSQEELCADGLSRWGLRHHVGCRGRPHISLPDYLQMCLVTQTWTAQVVLSQLGIPVMLLLCRFVLGKTYNAIQHLGAAVIIVGVLVVESPGLLHPSAEDSSNLPFFNLLFLLSILPSSLSYVVKEVAFRGVQMNTSFLQFWVALFQFFVGFALLPLTSLPLLGSGLKVERLGVFLFLHGIGLRPRRRAGVEVLVYILFNLIYNVCAMLVLKHCGATVLFLVMTVRLPLTSMAFYSKLIVGLGLRVWGSGCGLGLALPLSSSAAAAAADSSRSSSGRNSSSSSSSDSSSNSSSSRVLTIIILCCFDQDAHLCRETAQLPRGLRIFLGWREDEEVDRGEEGTLERDITATAEVQAAHVHIKVLASDPSIRNDGYFQSSSSSEQQLAAPGCSSSSVLYVFTAAEVAGLGWVLQAALVTALAAAVAVFWVKRGFKVFFPGRLLPTRIAVVKGGFACGLPTTATAATATAAAAAPGEGWERPFRYIAVHTTVGLLRQLQADPPRGPARVRSRGNSVSVP